VGGFPLHVFWRTPATPVAPTATTTRSIHHSPRRTPRDPASPFMNPSADTIVALSTPRGYSGVGVIRVSGPGALSLLETAFKAAQPSRGFPDRRAVYGTLSDPQSGMIVDDCIAVVMRGPRSYTGEDVAELSLHGSPVILDMVQRILISLGARPATRGEFTRRAFLSGRLDLIQAEAVIDLIEASCPGAVDDARARLDKSLSAEIRAIASEVKDLLAEIEAHIDFDEDEEEDRPDPLPSMQAILRTMETFLANAETGRIRREGARTAIVGKPNVGKSTLFNALLRADRAIVTPHAGTTRDSLEDHAFLRGVPFVLYDTAGIRENPEPVEQEGICRTRRRMEEADIVVAVVDGSAPLDDRDVAVLEACQGTNVVVALNKMDLGQAVSRESELLGPPDRARVTLSAKNGEGLETLEDILGTLERGLQNTAGGPHSTSLTQRGILLMQAATIPLARALEQIERTGMLAPEIISLELCRCLEPLEEITGEQWNEGVLDRIFDRFCVGK
jgi:tRNA modification GTPase